ncbi:MAG: glutamate formimidoyltransferase [candidate division NC10 bacterium]|nr:glutamate formimidoyltransferase [candidate division NC10 bacterium]
MKILQCVPNFSEGRDPNFLKELEAVLRQFPVKILDLSMDTNHNRADSTFLGASEAVEAAALAVTSRAVELIDMRHHAGSHPRMGAVDVVPFIPIRGMTMAEAVEIARRFGRAFAEKHQVPVFFYEEACTSESRRNLADIRKGEYEGMVTKLQDPAWRVDAGPQIRNEKSGVTAVGARMPLIAFNVNLHTNDLEVAKRIANAVRHVGGGLRYVKAMGLSLEDKGIVQVSMNLVNYQKTPIHRAVELIRAEAARYGVLVKECELVGMVPIEALEEVVSYYLQIPGFNAKQIIEYHLLPD